MTSEPGAPWVSAEELRNHGGPSDRQLRRLKEKNLLRAGYHFYWVGIKGGRHYYSATRIRELLVAIAGDGVPEIYDTNHAVQLKEAG